MALIKCLECGRYVSDMAKMCVHCGYPFDEKKVKLCGSTMRIVADRKYDLLVECSECKQIHSVPKKEFYFLGEDYCIPKDTIKCARCGKSTEQREKLYRTECAQEQQGESEAKRNEILKANSIECPRCGSISVEIMKKGFNYKRAFIGGALLGDIGLLGGWIGSNKRVRVCMDCSHEF